MNTTVKQASNDVQEILLGKNSKALLGIGITESHISEVFLLRLIFQKNTKKLQMDIGPTVHLILFKSFLHYLILFTAKNMKPVGQSRKQKLNIYACIYMEEA